MSRYTLNFGEIAPDDLARVGGKGLNLGELSRIEGISVPTGFCVATDAYDEVAASIPSLSPLLDRLPALNAEQRDAVTETAAQIRALFESAPIPTRIASEIAERYADLDKHEKDVPCAVRSSATAEDLPGASFAGQQDTYLNISGADSILLHVRKCWASLFTDRAVTYRIKNGFDHRRVALAVVVQRMVFPQASGIMFTADPLSGSRRTVSIDAGFGLGEALVSGIVSADNYHVRDGQIAKKTVSEKKVEIVTESGGGTREQRIDDARSGKQSLADEKILELAELGRRIEAHFSSGTSYAERVPQDIEWALADDALFILQSRPITTLYPIPEAEDDKLHVYVCANHIQMMTDAIRPLGLSFFEVLAEAYADIPTAGGRMYMDVSADLKSFIARKFLLYMFAETDVLIRNTVERFVAERPESVPRLSNRGSWLTGLKWEFFRWGWGALVSWWKGDTSSVPRFIDRYDAELKEKRDLFQTLSGDEVFKAIDYDVEHIYVEMTRSTDTGFLILWMISHQWLRKNLKKWLDEENAVDVLTKSVPNNPTSEMGLALLDVSLLARQYPDVLAYFDRIEAHTDLSPEAFFEGLRDVDGGVSIAEALAAFLEKYGARCSGEIDITRPRWNEQPIALIPMIRSNAENPDLTSGAERFEQGRLEAEAYAATLLSRIEKLPGGKRKARKAKKMIGIWRGVSGAREYPKFFMIQCFDLYKKAMLREADKLVESGVLNDAEDIYYLTLPELREAVKSGEANLEKVAHRREAYRTFEKLTPPRVMTSEGEILHGSYGERVVPSGALVGMPVSSGVVEGTARVVLRQEDAEIRPGDILVTPFTDPSWTPLFVSVAGLVTEVGGQMTHGAVITREYGLPAVVGVEDATKYIRDGQKIRLNGSEGWVQILEE